MTDDLEEMREFFSEVIEDHREVLWGGAEWKAPHEDEEGEKGVDEDEYSELSEREWAMFVAGKMEAFGVGKTLVEMHQSDSKQE